MDWILLELLKKSRTLPFKYRCLHHTISMYRLSVYIVMPIHHNISINRYGPNDITDIFLLQQQLLPPPQQAQQHPVQQQQQQQPLNRQQQRHRRQQQLALHRQQQQRQQHGQQQPVHHARQLKQQQQRQPDPPPPPHGDPPHGAPGLGPRPLTGLTLRVGVLYSGVWMITLRLGVDTGI